MKATYDPGQLHCAACGWIMEWCYVARYRQGANKVKCWNHDCENAGKVFKVPVFEIELEEAEERHL